MIGTVLRVLRAATSVRAVLRALVPDTLRVEWGQLVLLYPAELIEPTPAPPADPAAATRVSALAAGHTPGDDCPCGQVTVPVEHDNGEITFVHACRLAPDADPSVQAARAAAIFDAIAEHRREGGLP